MAGSSNTFDTSILVESKARRPLQAGETTQGLHLTVPSCGIGGSLGSPGLWRHVKAIVRFGLRPIEEGKNALRAAGGSGVVSSSVASPPAVGGSRSSFAVSSLFWASPASRGTRNPVRYQREGAW